MTADPVTIRREDRALVVTISREHAANSISREVVAGLERAVDEARAAGDLRALVLTGAGDRFFAAGGDIKQYRALVDRETLAESFGPPRRLMDALEALPIPVVAAVNGYALGGGAELMLAADLRLAAATARIGFPYVKLGLIAGWHGSERLARCCGYSNAMKLLLTGEPVDAREAMRIGLVNDVVEEGSVVDAALALARQFDSHAPLSLAATKRVMQGAYRLPPDALRELMDATFESLWLSEDHREAEAAFEEKRPPAFKGR